MDTHPTQGEIQAEVERLRALAPDTKALYREVAAALFFRFGIAPTANRLHQLVGKGSMATSAAALGLFWKNLREQGRLRIDHPALPEGLRDTAGALLGQIWKAAVAGAEEDLAAVREELDGRFYAAEVRVGEAEKRLEQAAERVQGLEAEIEAARAAVRVRDEQLSGRALELERLQGQLQAVTDTQHEREAAVRAAREAFGAELEGLRRAIDLTEERARATERRAMTDVEAAREMAKHSKRALAEEQRKRAAETKRLEAVVSKREQEVQVLREQLVRAETVATALERQLQRAEANLSKLLLSSKQLGPGKRPRKDRATPPRQR